MQIKYAFQVIKRSDQDKALLVGAGVTLHESLSAAKQLEADGIYVAVLDVFCVKPLDEETLRAEAKRVGGRVIVTEDHYQAGGIGEAVAYALSGEATVSCINVRELPRSGAPDALLDRYGISARHIVRAVKERV